MLLEQINGPGDLKKIPIERLPGLAAEIRRALIAKTSKLGGHLASNLGIVEITIALHYVFRSPRDKFVFDVSHQSYVHKMLTGRKDAFLDESRYGDVSGYSNPAESEHDLFAIGHTSTSISLACGLAKARDLRGTDENIIAVTGDASLDGGEAFEGLNCAGELGTGLIVVLNDNDMSIPENHGALSRYLTRLRESGGRAADNYFASLGFAYRYVPDGHDIPALIEAFAAVKDTKNPVLVHCRTRKGKGYRFAERDPENWHWARPFDVESGRFKSAVPAENYGAIAGDYLLKKMREDPRVAVVAASTPVCIGFNAERRRLAGKQYVDVGIAEAHAVTMAAGIAKGGGRPVFATNSTFFQRAYDQIEQEVAISKCPVTMIVTHASVFGHSNDTHVGLYDIALFSHVNNLIYLAPVNAEEYLAMLEWSLEQRENPVMIRVPWTRVVHTDREVPHDYARTRYETVRRGGGAAILAPGSFFGLGERVADLLASRGVNPTLVNPRFITGLDTQTLEELRADHKLVVTLEDGIAEGGFGAKIARYYGASSMRVLSLGLPTEIPNRFVPQKWLEECGLTPERIAEQTMRLLAGI